MKLTLQLPTQFEHKSRFAISNQIKETKGEIFPGSWCPVLRDALSRQAEMFQWGLSEAKMGQDDRLVYALKIEELFSKSGRASLGRRVLVPIKSFSVRCEGKTFLVKKKSEQAFALAGIWDIAGHWRGRPTHAFRIITGPTIDGLEELGDRLPVVLKQSNEHTWLWHFTDERAALDALEPESELDYKILGAAS